MKTIFVLVFTVVLSVACNKESNDSNINPPPPPPAPLDIETFTFSSNGIATKGDIYLPESYKTNPNLPTIYLIDFQERSGASKDEFETVINAVNQIEGVDALVVTLTEHLDIHSQPEDYQKYYTIFKDMASYVDSKYTDNTSRTFIARGGEAGIVIMTLFLEDPQTSIFENFIATDSPIRYNSPIRELIKSGGFPQNKGNKRFHFSFSDSNDFSSCSGMINDINKAEYPWLQFESTKYAGSYQDTYPAAFKAGIKHVFNK